jgi:hypothetical protein
MNRQLLGLLLFLASATVAADCKQDCRDAYKTCTQGAASLDDTMLCKKQYKDCAAACDAAGLAGIARGTKAAAGPGCDAADDTVSMVQASVATSIPTP